MNKKTLFNAYKEARNRMEQYVARRGFFGIAIDKDDRALKYQRYQRLARRIENRLNGERVCPFCGYPVSVCANGSWCKK